jgi:YHS domain-containing protein
MKRHPIAEAALLIAIGASSIYIYKHAKQQPPTKTAKVEAVQTQTSQNQPARMEAPQMEEAPQATPAKPVFAPAKTIALTKVESKFVCMLNNERFNRNQIPTVIDDKTYYGCCASAEETFKNTPSSRIAFDPISGNEVDKADAVIGANPKNKVYYFENEENLLDYSAD